MREREGAGGVKSDGSYLYSLSFTHTVQARARTLSRPP